MGNLCLLHATSEAMVAPKGSSPPGLAASEPPCPQLWPLLSKQAGLGVSRTCWQGLGPGPGSRLAGHRGVEAAGAGPLASLLCFLPSLPQFLAPPFPLPHPTHISGNSHIHSRVLSSQLQVRGIETSSRLRTWRKQDRGGRGVWGLSGSRTHGSCQVFWSWCVWSTHCRQCCSLLSSRRREGRCPHHFRTQNPQGSASDQWPCSPHLPSHVWYLLEDVQS